jgi:hypothetical protein
MCHRFMSVENVVGYLLIIVFDSAAAVNVFVIANSKHSFACEIPLLTVLALS